MINNSKKNACQDGIGNVSDKVKAALFVMSMICGAVASSSAMNTEVSNGLLGVGSYPVGNMLQFMSLAKTKTLVEALGQDGYHLIKHPCFRPIVSAKYANACQTMSPDNAMLELYGKSTSDMLIEDSKIIEQNVPLVAKVCQAIMKEQIPECANYIEARDLLNFLNLEPNHCLHPDPEMAVQLICGKPLRDLVRTGYYKKALDTLHNVKIAAKLQKSDDKQEAVERFMQRVGDAKKGAKAGYRDEDFFSYGIEDHDRISIYDMLTTGAMDELNNFTNALGINASSLISEVHEKGYEYFQYGVPNLDIFYAACAAQAAARRFSSPDF